jgi:hypothetical protein
MAANKGKDDIEEKTTLQPKANKKRTPKVKSYAEHQKRMNKKAYLSEHSEYLYIPIPEARDLVGINDKELIDNILEAALDNKNYIKVKRETYNKIKNGKTLQNGDRLV